MCLVVAEALLEVPAGRGQVKKRLRTLKMNEKRRSAAKISFVLKRSLPFLLLMC